MAREMWQSGRWLAPTFLGVPWFEKPPMIQWLIAVSFTLFGVGEGSARLPGVAAACANVLLTYGVARELFCERRARIAALLLPATYLWMNYGRLAVQDQILTAFELLGIWCLLIAARRGTGAWAAGWGLCLALGLFTKSTMVLLSAAAAVPYLLVQNRSHRLLRSPWLYGGLGIGMGLFGCWYFAASRVYGDVVYSQLIGKVLDLGRRSFHDVGPFYYLWNLPLNTFPWAFFALGGAWVCWRESKSSYFLPASYTLIMLGLLQLFSTKEAYYMIQICPWLAMFASVGIDALLQPTDGQPTGILAWTSGLLGGLGALLVCAASALVRFPVEGTAIYLMPAGVLGCCWILLGILYWQRQAITAWRRFWLGSLLTGPWSALVVAVLTTSIGNYSPEIKAFALTKLPALLPAGQPIHIVYEKDGVRVSEFIEQAFYTPHPASELTARAVIEKDPHGTWWLAPESRALLDRNRFEYLVLGEVKGWTLATGQP